MKIIGETEKRGTEVHFLPDLEIFSNIDFHYDILAKRLRELRSSTTACASAWSTSATTRKTTSPSPAA